MCSDSSLYLKPGRQDPWGVFYWHFTRQKWGHQGSMPGLSTGLDHFVVDGPHFPAWGLLFHFFFPFASWGFYHLTFFYFNCASWRSNIKPHCYLDLIPHWDLCFQPEMPRISGRGQLICNLIMSVILDTKGLFEHRLNGTDLCLFSPQEGLRPLLKFDIFTHILMKQTSRVCAKKDTKNYQLDTPWCC